MLCTFSVVFWDLQVALFYKVRLACVAGVSFPSPGREIGQASEQAGKQISMPGVSKKLGKVGRGGKKALIHPCSWKCLLTG